jgi:divalent metal cation (Fe/Co/Zn/Cd) transporter
MESDPSVLRIIHLRTEHLAPDELLVATKIELDAALDFVGVADAIDRVEASVRAAVPEAKLMYVEPDVYRHS